MPQGKKIPERDIGKFKERIGTPIKKIDHDENILITVGDVVSLAVRNSGIVPDISVYDGMTERRTMTDFALLVKNEGLEEVVVNNPAGTVTCELFAAVKNALARGSGVIRVVGEEDLAVIPCILLSPKGTRIVYGWPREGMMLITTSDIIRQEAKKLWNMMEEFE